MTHDSILTDHLAASLAGAVRSHISVHIPGRIAPMEAPVVDVTAVIEEDHSAQDTAPVEVLPTRVVTEDEPGDSQDIEETAPDRVGPVRPAIATSEPVEDMDADDVSEDIEPVSEDIEPVSEDIEPVSEDIEDTAPAPAATVEGEEDPDLADLGIDVSAYLSGGTTSDFTATSEPASPAEDIATDAEPVREDDNLEQAIEETPVDSAPVVEDIDEDFDMDMGDFNPMKYLGGQGQPSTPTPEPTVEEEEPREVEINTKRDPISLLRELSALSR